MKIMRDRAVQTSAAAGGLIALTAFVGAGRFPVVYAMLATVWVVVTIAAVIGARRRAG